MEAEVDRVRLTFERETLRICRAFDQHRRGMTLVADGSGLKTEVPRWTHMLMLRN